FEVWSRRISYRDRPAVQALSLEVTERVHADEKMSELAAKYHHAQKLEAVGRLAGGIAHEFNNLLTVILCGAMLAAKDRDTPARVKQEMENIRTAAERGGELTRQLLTFSRREMPSKASLDLNAALRGVETVLRRLVRENVNLRFMLHPDPLW